MSMLLKAPYILTMTGDVITNGAIRTDGARIVEVGAAVKATKADATMKLDQCIVLPGLVNAHCHLDLSYLAGRLPAPASFTQWVEQVIAARQTASERDVADGLRNALQQCYRSGITCIGDHVGHFGALPLLLQMPLKGRAFLEVAGTTEQRARQVLADAAAALRRHEAAAKRMSLHLTPHAAYSLHPTVLRELLVGAGSDPLSIHCAETEQEWECFTLCRGPLYDLVTGLGLPALTPSRSPVDYIERHGGLTKRMLLVHANHLHDADIEGIRAAKATVVHCPQSHRYFRAPDFPLERLRAAGIPVALGTDSLASTPTLNLLTEMQLVKERFPAVSAEEIVAMATVHGANALGYDALCGRIAPGYAADIIAVRCVDPNSDPYENVLRNADIPFVVIDGRIVRNILKGEHGV